MGNNQYTEWKGEYGDLIRSIIRLCNESAMKFCRPADYHIPFKITAHEIQVIEYILESDENEKMSEIAARLGITRGAFSNNVTKLIKLGCLEKTVREGNKKNRYVTVTDYGKQIYQQYAEFVFERSFKEMFKTADKIPKKHIKAFSDMLNHFTDSLV